MRWTDFLEDREGRRARARSAARELRAGHRQPALGLLGSWRLPDGCAERLLDELIGRPPRPTARAWQAVLAPADELPRPESDPHRASWLHHRWLVQQGGPVEVPATCEPLAWALAELHRLGGEVERRERAAWREREFAVGHEDAVVTELWRRWGQGRWALDWAGSERGEQAPGPYWARCWRDFCDRAGDGGSVAGWAEAWRCLLLDQMLRGARGALRQRGVVGEALERLQLEWEENITIHLMGGAPGVPLRSVLAARVVEGTGAGPVSALARLLSEDGRGLVGRCVATRGSRGQTAAWLYAEVPDRSVRAELLVAGLGAAPEGAEGFLDAHVARSLVLAWSEGRATTPTAAWDTVMQHRLRARSRLRAAVARSSEEALLHAVSEVDAVRERTVQALRLLGRSWAHDGVAWSLDGFVMLGGWEQSLAPPCEDATRGRLRPLPAEALPALQAWTLLVVLRGRLRHLLDWVRQGGTGGDDGRWNRLRRALPDAWVRGAEQERRDYAAVRSSLAAHLPSLLQPAPDLLRAFVRQPGDQAALQAWLTERWPSTAIPPPAGRLPSLQRERARELDALLRDLQRARAEARRHPLHAHFAPTEGRP